MQQQGVENLPAAVWLLPLQYPACPLAAQARAGSVHAGGAGARSVACTTGTTSNFFP